MLKVSTIGINMTQWGSQGTRLLYLLKWNVVPIQDLALLVNLNMPCNVTLLHAISGSLKLMTGYKQNIF